jgi:hypothetical protein
LATSVSTAANPAGNTANDPARGGGRPNPLDTLPSLITVEVLGYGGGSGDTGNGDDKKEPAPPNG